MAYFIGEGYSQGFSAHMADVIASLAPDAPVRLTVGVDVVCAGCPHNVDGECHKPDLVAKYDQSVLDLCGIAEGSTMPFGVFTALVQSRILDPGLRRGICGDCQWDGLCSGQRSRWKK